MKGCRAFELWEWKAVSKELNVRDACLFVLGIRTGFRISELLSLNIDHVVDDNGNCIESVTVLKRNTKGKTEGKTVPLHEDARVAIDTYLRLFPGKNVDPLFRSKRRRGVCGRLEKSVFHKALKKAVSRAGINANSVATHSMRKTFAKNIFEATGRDLMMLQIALAHKSIDSTVRYLQIDREKVWNAIKGIKGE